MSVMGSIGEFPDVVKDVFVTKQKNNSKIHVVRIYIRNKPWLIAVDS